MAERQYVAELLLKLEAETAVRDATTVMRKMKREADAAEETWRKMLASLAENDIKLGSDVDLSSFDAVKKALQDIAGGGGLTDVNGKMLNLSNLAGEISGTFEMMRHSQNELTQAATKTVQAQQFLKDTIEEQKAPIQEAIALEKARAKEIADAEKQASADAREQKKRDAKEAALYKKEVATLYAEQAAAEEERLTRETLAAQLRASEQVVAARKAEAEAATQALRDAETRTGKRGNAPEIQAERDLATEKNRIFIEAERERLNVARKIAEQEVAIRRAAYERAAQTQVAAGKKGGGLEAVAARDTISALNDLGNAQMRVTEITEQQAAMRMQAEQRVAKTVTKTTLASQNVIRIIQDAPYGMMGITNNLQAMGESLGYLMNTIDPMTNKMHTFGGAVRATMGGLLKGPMLVSLIITVLSTLILQWDKVLAAVDSFKELMGEATAEIRLTSKAMKEFTTEQEKAFADAATVEEVASRYDDLREQLDRTREAYYAAGTAAAESRGEFNVFANGVTTGMETANIKMRTAFAFLGVELTEAQARLKLASEDLDFLEARFEEIERSETANRIARAVWASMEREEQEAQARILNDEIVSANSTIVRYKQEIAEKEREVTQAILDGNEAAKERLKTEIAILRLRIEGEQSLDENERAHDKTGRQDFTDAEIAERTRIRLETQAAIRRAEAEAVEAGRTRAKREGRDNSRRERAAAAAARRRQTLDDQFKKNQQILQEALTAQMEDGFEKEAAAIRDGYSKKKLSLERGHSNYASAVIALENALRIELERLWAKAQADLAANETKMFERRMELVARRAEMVREIRELAIEGDTPGQDRARLALEQEAAREELEMARTNAAEIARINQEGADQYEIWMHQREVALATYRDAQAAADEAAMFSAMAAITEADANIERYQDQADAIIDSREAIVEAEQNYRVVMVETSRDIRDSLREERHAFEEAARERANARSQFTADLAATRAEIAAMGQSTNVGILDFFGIEALRPGDFTLMGGFSEAFEAEIATERSEVNRLLDQEIEAIRAERDATLDTLAGRDDPESHAIRQDAVLNAQEAEIEAIRRAEMTKEQIEAEGNAKRLAAKREFWGNALSIASSILDSITQAATTAYQTWAEERGRELDEMGVSEEEKAKIIEEEGAKQFERQKKLQIAQAWVQGLSGAVSAYAGAQVLGPIAGPIVGGINAAAVLAMTAMNVKRIKAMKPGGSGGAGSASAGFSTGSYGALGAAAAAERVSSFNAMQGAANNPMNDAARRMEDAATTFETTARGLTVAIEPHDSAGIVGHGVAYRSLTDGNR